MSTRFKRPDMYRQFVVGSLLVAFQIYLGYSALNGQYGISSQKQLVVDVEILRAQEASLKAEIDAFRLRIDLFDPTRLDPDILSEKARALLSMARPDDILISIADQ